MPEKDKHPNVHAAKRGCRSVRQWQDIRQAARLARTEGVTIELHGVTESHLKQLVRQAKEE